MENSCTIQKRQEPSEPSDQVTKTIKYMKVVCQQSGVDLCDCYRAIGGYKIRSSVRVTYSGKKWNFNFIRKKPMYVPMDLPMQLKNHEGHQAKTG
ncbi:21844_t:CDS:2 [Rhizophagus irregularis]|nr:21844_t:CDS:2 [Rhizophagus irregularis]